MQSDQPRSSNMPSSSESLKPSCRTSPTLGSDSSHKQAASPNTATSQTASASVSPSTSPASYPLRPPRTAPPSLNSAVNSLKSSRTSSPKAATLAHSPGTTSKLSLVPFNPPHSLSFQNRPKLTSSAFFKTILSHTKYLPPSLTLPLTLSSIQMTFRLLGVLSLLLVYCYADFLPAPKSPPGTCLKPTGPSRFTLPSGQQQSPASTRIASLSTRPYASASPLSRNLRRGPTSWLRHHPLPRYRPAIGLG